MTVFAYSVASKGLPSIVRRLPVREEVAGESGSRRRRVGLEGLPDGDTLEPAFSVVKDVIQPPLPNPQSRRFVVRTPIYTAAQCGRRRRRRLAAAVCGVCVVRRCSSASSRGSR